MRRSSQKAMGADAARSRFPLPFSARPPPGPPWSSCLGAQADAEATCARPWESGRRARVPPRLATERGVCKASTHCSGLFRPLSFHPSLHKGSRPRAPAAHAHNLPRFTPLALYRPALVEARKTSPRSLGPLRFERRKKRPPSPLPVGRGVARTRDDRGHPALSFHRPARSHARDATPA